MNNIRNLTTVFLLVFVIAIFPRHGNVVSAQSAGSNPSVDVLTNMEDPNTVPLVNNMLRQNANATATLQGYFNSNGYLSATSGGTGANITTFPNGSLLTYDSSNVGIGTTNQGTSGQVLTSNGVSVKPSFTDLPHSYQVFTSNGSFTAPTGITTVYLTMVNGGTAGTSGSNVGGNGGNGGTGGSSGVSIPYTVVAGNSYPIVIGTVGGGISTFNGISLATLVNGTAAAAGVGGVGSNVITITVAGTTGGSGVGVNNGGGGGGSSIFGVGGTGGVGQASCGTNACPQPGGNGTGYGAGGGGGGADNGGAVKSGGTGTAGIVIVQY